MGNVRLPSTTTYHWIDSQIEPEQGYTPTTQTAVKLSWWSIRMFFSYVKIKVHTSLLVGFCFDDPKVTQQYLYIHFHMQSWLAQRN